MHKYRTSVNRYSAFFRPNMIHCLSSVSVSCSATKYLLHLLFTLCLDQAKSNIVANKVNLNFIYLCSRRAFICSTSSVCPDKVNQMNFEFPRIGKEPNFNFEIGDSRNRVRFLVPKKRISTRRNSDPGEPKVSFTKGTSDKLNQT
jgi:hypothetical protein